VRKEIFMISMERMHKQGMGGGGTIEGAKMEVLPEGKNLHAHIVKIGYESDRFVLMTDVEI
jgi:hypothetical protein